MGKNVFLVDSCALKAISHRYLQPSYYECVNYGKPHNLYDIENKNLCSMSWNYSRNVTKMRFLRERETETEKIITTEIFHKQLVFCMQIFLFISISMGRICINIFFPYIFIIGLIHCNRFYVCVRVCIFLANNIYFKCCMITFHHFES